jgi:hypothetical protein
LFSVNMLSASARDTTTRWNRCPSLTAASMRFSIEGRSASASV